MTRIAVIGPLHGEHGQGEFARALCADLRRVQGLDVEFLDVDIHAVHAGPPAWADRAPELPDQVLVLMNPSELLHLAAWLGHRFFARRKVAGFWWWETDTMPAAWTVACGLVHEIWTASSYVRDNLARSCPNEVRLCPLPAALLEPLPAPMRPDEAGFRFLFSFDVRSSLERKNPLGIVAAYVQAFPQPHPGIGLTLKSNGGSAAAITPALPTRADIRLIEGFLSRADFLDLVASHDAYVSLHRSEGLGLGMLEAMRLGKPVVATAYSGNLQFMAHDSPLLVPARQVPVQDAQHAYGGLGTWADPDTQVAATLMRRLAADPAAARRIGAANREHVAGLARTTALPAFLQQSFAPDRAWPDRPSRLARGFWLAPRLRGRVGRATAAAGRALARRPRLHALAKRVYARLRGSRAARARSERRQA